MKYLIFKGLVIFYVIITVIMIAAIPYIGVSMFAVPLAIHEIRRQGGVKATLRKIRWYLAED